jgi:hypothetical protein
VKANCFVHNIFDEAKTALSPMPFPKRPLGMGAEQLADFAAACEGKITWRQYFAKWGPSALHL